MPQTKNASVNIQSIDEIKAHLSKNTELPEHILDKALETGMASIRKNIEKLEKAVETKNYDVIKLTAHSLKSTLGVLGITYLFEKAREIERNAAEKENTYPYKEQLTYIAIIFSKIS